MFPACVRTCNKTVHPVQSGAARLNHYKHQPQHEFLVLKIKTSAVVRVNKNNVSLFRREKIILVFLP